MDARSLQPRLDTHYPAFARTHRLPEYVRVAVHALRSCRTATLGGHVQACPEGHIERVWYNSCRHRFCPQCAQLQIAQWLERQRARLLACDHYHVIFTIPSELNALWLANVRVFAALLFGAVWATVSELLADSRYLGARPGMIAALHTWGQTLVLHPHLHCLVTGGGLTGDTWKAVRNGYLLPARVVMPVFRGKLLAAVGKALDAEHLTLPPGLAPHQLRMLLNRLGRKQWPVQIMARYAQGRGVVTYLARYLRGGPLSPARGVAWDDQTVTLRYADTQDPDAQGRGRRKLLTLPVEEFLHRWLLHVPPPGLQVVRAYGLSAPTKRAALAQGRHALGQAPLEVPPALDWQMYCAQRGARHPEGCPVCGQRLIRRAAQGFRGYLVDADRLVHLLSWHQIQSDEELFAALQQVKDAGLIPEEAVRLCVGADGAPWIWHGVARLFPTAREILDYYQCSQHIHSVAELHYGAGAAAALEWVEATMARLFAGKVDGVIWGLQRLRPATAVAAAAIDKLMGYLREHSHRLNYGAHRKAGYPVGSGGIESANKFICHARLKRSGAWWYVANSNHMLALRCAKYNGTFERVFDRYKQTVLVQSQHKNVKK